MRASGRSSPIRSRSALRGLRLQLVGLGDERAAASISGMPLRARVVVQHLQRGVAEAALGHVDDALEGEVVGRLAR